MLVSGAVYTFIALLATILSVASVVYGVYLVSMTITLAVSGSIERAGLIMWQAVAFGLVAYTCLSFAHNMAKRSIALLDSRVDIDDEEEDDYYE